jgi:hypothetical protein
VRYGANGDDFVEMGTGENMFLEYLGGEGFSAKGAVVGGEVDSSLTAAMRSCQNRSDWLRAPMMEMTRLRPCGKPWSVGTWSDAEPPETHAMVRPDG